MNDRSGSNDARRPAGPDREALEGGGDEIQPDVMRRDRDAAGRDTVSSTSAESFPASDPPSWSGSASVPVDREPPPYGAQAAWSVDVAPTRGAAGAAGTPEGSLDQTDAPDADLPVPVDDARQA